MTYRIILIVKHLQFNLEEKIEKKLNCLVLQLILVTRATKLQDVHQINHLLIGLDRLQDKKITIDKKHTQGLAPGDLRDFYYLKQRKAEELSRLDQQQSNQKLTIASEAELEQAIIEFRSITNKKYFSFSS